MEKLVSLRMCLERLLTLNFVGFMLKYFARLRQRIRYASYVCNFLRIWRRWVFRTGNLTLKANFITRECFQDVTLSCHFAVLLIKATRDFTPNNPVLLSKSGSDVCEDFFSQNGSFVMNKHNYAFSDMLQNLSSMNRLLEIRADPKGPVIPKGHKKQENIWHLGNLKPENGPNMTLFPTDAEMIDEWEAGLQQAQNKLRGLGVQPPDDGQPPDDPDNDWFYRPHKLADQDDFAMLDLMTSEDDENSDEAKSDEEKDLKELELLSILRQHGDEIDITNDDPTDVPNGKISTTVDVPGVGTMYKSTIVSKLNSTPDISKDRLKRVRESGLTVDVNTVTINSSTDIGLWTDCGVFVKDPGQRVEYKIGRVQHIRNKGARGYIEYKRPVNLNDSDKLPKVEFLLSMYQHDSGNQYKYTPTNQLEFNIYSVIMGVSMRRNADSTYILDSYDKRALDTFNADQERTTKPRKTKHLCPSVCDGRRITVIRNKTDRNSDLRRSNRLRKVVTYDAS